MGTDIAPNCLIFIFHFIIKQLHITLPTVLIHCNKSIIPFTLTSSYTPVVEDASQHNYGGTKAPA